MSRVGRVALAAMGLMAAASCGSRSSLDGDFVDASVVGGNGDGGVAFGGGGSPIGGFGGSSTIGGSFGTGTGGVPAGGGAPGRGGSPGVGGIPGRGGSIGAGGVPNRGGSFGAGGLPGRGGSFGAGGTTGRGGAGGAGGSFGAGGTFGRGGAGGAGGTGILPILPGVIPTPGCVDCVNRNCNGTMACASDPVCVRGLSCTFANCTANGPPSLPCVLACFLGDLQAAGVALRDVLCVYSACGPSCTITAP